MLAELDYNVSGPVAFGAFSVENAQRPMFNPLPFAAEMFTQHLALRQFPGYQNPWANGDKDERAAKRRQALAKHLSLRHPVYLLLSPYAQEEDAGESGIPLVSEHAATMGIVPGLNPQERLTDRPFPAYDNKTSELWRSLNMSQVADRSICFSIIPWIPDPGHKPTEPEYNQHFRWARTLIRWYPDMTVVAVGEKASRILTLNGMKHKIIKPPKRTGVSIIDQVFDLVESNPQA